MWGGYPMGKNHDQPEWLKIIIRSLEEKGVKFTKEIEKGPKRPPEPSKEFHNGKSNVSS